MVKLFPNILIGFFCILLVGCMNFAPTSHQDTQTYTLGENLMVPPKHYEAKPVTVMVNFGQALPGLQTDRMAYEKNGDFQLRYYAYHRWVAPPVTLLTTSITNALAQTDAYKAVVNAPMYVGKVDYQVGVQLLALQQNFSSDTASQEKLSLQIVVIDARNNQIVAAKRFEQVVEAAPNAEGGVAAANQALAQLMPNVVQFIYNAIWR